MLHWSLLLLLTLACAGCSGIRRETKLEKNGETQKDGFLITSYEVKGVHFFEITKQGQEGKRPIVFFHHGLDGKKEHMVDVGKQLAVASYIAVLPDCAGHGENASRQSMDFLEVMEKTASNIDVILEAYKNSQYADSSRFALGGCSMGAMISLYYGAWGKQKPTAIVSICGTPDWNSLEQNAAACVRLEKGEKVPIDSMEEQEALWEALKSHSPDKNIEKLMQVPIFMINGTEDTVIPLSGTEAFAKKAQAYHHRLTYQEIAGHGHKMREDDLAAMVEFLENRMMLVDTLAEESVISVYGYLRWVGSSGRVIYGHQGDTWLKAGASGKGLSESDAKDMAGSIAGVVGMDTLSLAGAEYMPLQIVEAASALTAAPTAHDTQANAAAASAVHESQANTAVAPAAHKSQANTAAAPTACQSRTNVTAAALLANDAIQQGAIITLSCHMPNFSLVQENTAYEPSRDPTYARYDFRCYTPKEKGGNTVNGLLPGGRYHEKFTAFLDMIADYAGQVEGPVLFRPFHECTGDWFWWGSDSCSPEVYREVFQYTVKYLRDTKQVHNFLYVYSPGSEADYEFCLSSYSFHQTTPDKSA